MVQWDCLGSAYLLGGFSCPEKANWEAGLFLKKSGCPSYLCFDTIVRELIAQRLSVPTHFSPCRCKYRASAISCQVGISIELGRIPESWGLHARLAVSRWLYLPWESERPWICRRRQIGSSWSRIPPSLSFWITLEAKLTITLFQQFSHFWVSLPGCGWADAMLSSVWDPGEAQQWVSCLSVWNEWRQKYVQGKTEWSENILFSFQMAILLFLTR